MVPSKSQEESVDALAQVAVHSSGAAGYALYALDQTNGALLLRSSGGTSFPQPENLTLNRSVSRGKEGTVISYPLRLGGTVIGILAFSFRRPSVPDDRPPVLDRMARAIETLYCLPYAAAQLFAKVNHVETELAAAKISARAHGFLENTPAGPSGQSGQADQTVAAIERHVDTVLRSSRLWPVLKGLLREGQEEVTEREVIAQAKALLQRTHSMSEEQAHNHLRLKSRRNRKRIEDIAREMLASSTEPNHPQPAQPGKTPEK